MYVRAQCKDMRLYTPDIVFPVSLVHISSEPVYRPPTIHCPASPVPSPMVPLPFVAVSVVFKERPLALQRQVTTAHN